MTQTILTFLDHLILRPKMFIGHNRDLDSRLLRIYLTGVITGLEIECGADLHEQLFNYTRTRTMLNYNIVWDEMILSFHNKKNDQDIKSILIQTLEDFFTENSDWEKSKKTKQFNILEILAAIKTHEPMFVNEKLDSVTLSVHLEGIIQGLQLGSGASFHWQLFYYVRTKTIRDYDIGWTDMILDYHKDKTDDALKAVLIKTLEGFFKENPDWDKYISPKSIYNFLTGKKDAPNKN